MRNRIEQLDSYELRTAMLWGWVFALCVSATVISVRYGADFVPIPCAIFALMSLFEAIRWFAKSTRVRQHENYEEEEDEEIEQLAPVPIVQAVQPVKRTVSVQPTAQYRVVQFDETDTRHYSQLKQFVNGVVQSGLVSRSKWVNDMDWTVQDYSECMDALIRAGVVLPRGQGKTPDVVVSTPDAAWARINAMLGINVLESLEASRVLRTKGKVIVGPSGAAQ